MIILSEAMRRRYRAVTMSLLNFCPGIRREVSSAQQLWILAHSGRGLPRHHVSDWSPGQIAVTRGPQEFIEGRISEGDLRSLAESLQEPHGDFLAEKGVRFWRSWVDDFLRDNGARYFPVFTARTFAYDSWISRLTVQVAGVWIGPVDAANLYIRDRAWGEPIWLKFVRPGSDLLVALALARTRKKGRFAQLKALVLTENGASILAAVRMARALDLLPQMSVEARQLGLEKIT